jgi:glycosyltransferase involved in cell wall biosynthesis
MLLPKVLIINQPFNSNTGGGITLSNLFGNWDREKLAVACSGYLLAEDMDPKLCNNYYQLGSKERKWIFPFNLLSQKYYSGAINIKDKATSKDKVVVKKSKLRVKLITNYMLPIFDFMGFSHFQAKTKLSSSFCKWLDDFNPNVIYVQASTRESILFCIAVHEYLKRPMVFHMMDDWPTLIGVRGALKKFWKRKIDKEFRLLLDRADLLMGISDYMCEDYNKRYGKKFVTFHNPINLGFWKKAQRHNYELAKSPTLLYAGRIGLGIDKSLRNIAEAVKRLNKELHTDLKFIIQTQDDPIWIKNFKNVERQDFVAYEELPSVFAQADILILPYDFSPESLSFIKYSMPTKAPEYMASGTPIIVFAPEETAIVRNARKYNWARIITENSIKAVSIGIKEMIESRELRQQYAKNAILMAEKNYNSTKVTTKFRNEICSTLKS